MVIAAFASGLDDLVVDRAGCVGGELVAPGRLPGHRATSAGIGRDGCATMMNGT